MALNDQDVQKQVRFEYWRVPVTDYVTFYQ